MLFTCYFAYSCMFCFRTAQMDIRPNHTIYINRLNEKVKKEGRYKLVAYS